MTEEDEKFDRIAAKCKETQRVNESKWHSEMCSNYGGFCKKEWVGLTDEEIQECLQGLPTQTIDVYARRIESKLKDKNNG